MGSNVGANVGLVGDRVGSKVVTAGTLVDGHRVGSLDGFELGVNEESEVGESVPQKICLIFGNITFEHFR